MISSLSPKLNEKDCSPERVKSYFILKSDVGEGGGIELQGLGTSSVIYGHQHHKKYTFCTLV